MNDGLRIWIHDKPDISDPLDNCLRVVVTFGEGLSRNGKADSFNEALKLACEYARQLETESHG